MWNEEKLNQLLTTPSDALIEDIKKIKGDIMILGAGGKMGPTLCVLAKKACKAAGVEKKIYAVSRGSDKIAEAYMKENEIEVIAADLLNKEMLYALPDVENIIYMAGKKFGTDGNETISVDEIAKKANTINYEIICNINSRVTRVYMKNGKVESAFGYLLSE